MFKNENNNNINNTTAVADPLVKDDFIVVALQRIKPHTN